MLLRPSRLAVAVARDDHHDVLVLRNELNEHIRPGMLVWGVSKFSAEKKMKEQPSFYAFFIRKMVAPTGDPKEIAAGAEIARALANIGNSSRTAAEIAVLQDMQECGVCVDIEGRVPVACGVVDLCRVLRRAWRLAFPLRSRVEPYRIVWCVPSPHPGPPPVRSTRP